MQDKVVGGAADDATATLRDLVLVRPAITLTVTFVVSRVLYRAAGVTFDASPLDFAWQLIDPALLEGRLLESVWYSHTQPPLFNLALGVLMNVSPLSDALTFQFAYLGLGLAIALLAHDLLGRLGVGPSARLALAAGLSVSPATVLFENYLFYTYPTTALLLATMVALHRFAEQPTTRRYALYATFAAAIVLTRSIFHPIWYVLVALAPVLLAEKRARRALVGAALVPLVVVVGWMVRAELLFGTSQLSSWSPMNAARTVTLQIPLDERQALVDDGKLSPFALEQAFQRMTGYEDVATPCDRKRPDVAVLNGALKSTGYPNFNDECYLPIYASFAGDLGPAFRADPGAFARTFVTAVQMHLQPSSLYSQVDTNQEQIAEVDKLVRRTVLLEVTVPFVATPEPYEGLLRLQGDPLELRMSLTVMLAELATLAMGARALVRLWRGDRSASTVTLAVLAFTVVWVLAVGNAFELQENHRFRFMIDPLLLVGAAAGATRLVRGLRRAPASSPPQTGVSA